MNSKEFFAAVYRMRELQKRYFKTRDKVNLELSMNEERKIDEEIQRVIKIHEERGLNKFWENGMV